MFLLGLFADCLNMYSIGSGFL